jgi:hypothetical protein
VSKEKAFTPDAAHAAKKPVVLVINSIHAGEVDGTDASLILLRDVALGNANEVLDAVTLLVVPVYNVDGHARFGKYNRPNQDGPAEGMGFRTNAAGLDLNRDFMKADALETRALLSLVNAWNPDLFVDDHVTDGADFQLTLTVLYRNEPASAPALSEWLSRVVPAALRDVEEAGWKTGPYVDFVDNLDPLKGIDTGPTTPRYSTGYFPSRNIPSILVETHAIKPYDARVRANLEFLRALFVGTGREAASLKAAREKAASDARSAAAGSPFIAASETDMSRPEPFEMATYAFENAVSDSTGKPTVRYDRRQPITARVPVYTHVKPTVTVPRPAGYIVPAGWPDVKERLLAHGIPFATLDKTRSLDVGTYRASNPVYAKTPYQGRMRVEAKIARGVETRSVPAGSLYVPLDTPLAPVAMHLLEPESPDSLFAWGFFSSIFEMKEYIDARVLDPLVRAMLSKDPKLAAEWKAKLADPAFAADSTARYRYWYSKTPYWDETLGLVPVYRLEKPLAK